MDFGDKGGEDVSRLIDADALHSNFFDYSAREMVWDRGDVEHKINEMPTIDAIPVEWIEWQIMNAKYNGIKEAADAFEFVLNCYKEQETQK